MPVAGRLPPSFEDEAALVIAGTWEEPQNKTSISGLFPRGGASEFKSQPAVSFKAIIELIIEEIYITFPFHSKRSSKTTFIH